MLVPVSAKVSIANVADKLFQSVGRDVRVNFAPFLDLSHVKLLLSDNKLNDLLEDFVVARDNYAKNKDLIFVNGLDISLDNPFAEGLNLSVARALDAAIIFVLADEKNIDNSIFNLKILAHHYTNNNRKIVGCLFDCTKGNFTQLVDKYNIFSNMNFKVLGEITMDATTPASANWIRELAEDTMLSRLTPAAFSVQLIQNARSAAKRIVLPEGDEPRTLQAVNICAEKQLAHCILLGNPESIHQAAAKIGITLNSAIEIIDPKTITEKYVNPLYELRKAKGLTIEQAREQLKDNVVLGTMMLHFDEVDGLVSGAVHTTANTIRPPLQIIKMAPGCKIVSSVFFICLPDQVLVYGDCAINPNPTAEELAEIAIQSAETAAKFGIPPRVAMLSYSTGDSGTGPDVDLVKEATKIAKQKRPDLLIEGPIQYDAAVAPDVASLKLPNSQVAGKATVFIFPNLNAGNIAYKTVQRSTNVVCMGPLLQGIKKPVNDLSRGCLIEDIVFTIALTAVQAI